MGKAMRMAFYGKGGIGKSTITANLAAVYGKNGKHVLYIGCDPKADSVRKLTGKRIPTVLSQINRLGDGVKREDIVYSGDFGVSCIEAGGPQAGVGCAGMGISAMAAELERLHILEEDWDIILYDVLGDVVCGGFSIPMRRQFATRVYLITSADYMSLYAANNILKSVVRCSSEADAAMGGIVLNHCKDSSAKEVIALFNQMTQTECIGMLTESDEINYADYMERTVIRQFPDGKSAAFFKTLADRLLTPAAGTRPRPLEEEELEKFRKRLMGKVGGCLGNSEM